MDLASMIIAASNSLVPVFWVLLWSLGGLIGILYSGMALQRMQSASIHPGRRPITLGGTLIVLIIGAAIFNLAKTITIGWNTFADSSVSFGLISYSGADDFGRFKDAVNAVLSLAGVAGGFFSLKGLMCLKKATVDGESSRGSEDVSIKGITHIVAGAALVNVDKMIEAVRQTFHLFW
ncbi:conjugal transfer protein TraQ [Pseudomonas oryzihabitans]|nr:conjugal transfer protein TraQ [Pseudomonas oryzihabitans]